MSGTSDFSLKVVAHACEGGALLRERLAGFGLDTTLVAGIVGYSPLSLARATKSGSTPRGMLVSMAVLETVMDELAARGIGVNELATGGAETDAAAHEVADQSPVAAKMIARILAHLPPAPAQLSFTVATRAAA